jgi:preprotein translocase subunit SecD
MQPRSKWWIITIIVLFALSFLYAFQPLRLKPKAVEVNSVFRYTFATPLVQTDADMPVRGTEINQYLSSKGMGSEIDRVEFKEKNVLEIETFAFDEKQAASDRQKILGLLTEKYPGVTAMAMPEEQQRDQPLSVLGPFALYKPKPQVQLGLDLIGGARVVLRALPETTLTFRAPEDRPLVKMAAPTPAAGTAATPPVKPVVEASLTPDMLSDRVRNTLVKAGVRIEGADDLQIEFPAAYIMVVKTRAESKSVAEKQKALVQSFLERTYPGVAITGEEPASVFLDKDTAEQVKNIIEKRVYEMGEIREPVLQTQGVDRIIVELPGVSEPERVVSILKSTAMLEFRVLPDRYEAPGAADDDFSEWRDKQTQQSVPWSLVMAETRPDFTGRDLKSNATVSPDSQSPGYWVVNFELRDDRKQAFREFTRRNVQKNMAIILDGKPQMAPVIKGEIPGQGIIEGHFTAQQAGDLKLLLNAGALPVPLEIAENRTISATLGTYAIQRSLLAGAIGLSLVVLFMIVFYRLPGLLADVALALYVLVVLAVLTFTKTTLTLPGIAGIILSIGMAVDANILIFERLKEEIWAGKTIRAAIDAGFERAWTAILDSNVNSMIVAAVLYFLGTSSIKSFAVTLFVGVVCSLFTAVTVSRWMVTMVGHSRLGQRLHMFGVHQESL